MFLKILLNAFGQKRCYLCGGIHRLCRLKFVLIMIPWEGSGYNEKEGEGASLNFFYNGINRNKILHILFLKKKVRKELNVSLKNMCRKNLTLL